MSPPPQDLLSLESSGACSPEQIQEPEAPQVGSQGPTSRAMVFKSDPWAISTRITWNVAEMKLTGQFQSSYLRVLGLAPAIHVFTSPPEDAEGL